MLKNYLLIAWKVFLRRKLFTFINLFGICLTLTVIMVGITISTGYLYPDGPEKRSRQFLTFERLVLTNEKHSSTQSGKPGYKFLVNNVSRLKSPELISFATSAKRVNTFNNDRKFSYLVRHTDTHYWKILDFDFIDGRAFNDDELNQGKMVAIIDQHTAASHYGDLVSALGKKIQVGEQSFSIIGVVEDVPANETIAMANVWLPHTTNASSSYQKHEMDNWLAILYHSDTSRLGEIQEEFVYLLKNNLVLSRKNGMSKAFGGAYSKLESVAKEIFAGTYEYEYQSGVDMLVFFLILSILLFMALPSINMININISRIYERASEIGVRKAFGASSRQLVGQFIVENILLTLIGGVMAMFISILVIGAVESSGMIPYTNFSFNFRVFVFGLFATLIMSFLSGIFPALKMSRLNPADSLKGGSH